MCNSSDFKIFSTMCCLIAWVILHYMHVLIPFEHLKVVKFVQLITIQRKKSAKEFSPFLRAHKFQQSDNTARAQRQPLLNWIMRCLLVSDGSINIWKWICQRNLSHQRVSRCYFTQQVDLFDLFVSIWRKFVLLFLCVWRTTQWYTMSRHRIESDCSSAHLLLKRLFFGGGCVNEGDEGVEATRSTPRSHATLTKRVAAMSARGVTSTFHLRP
jgi:hypothetical protein